MMGLEVHGGSQFPILASSPQLVFDEPKIGAPIGGWLKRMLDFAAAAILIVLFSPLFLLIGLLVKVSDGGPVFYRHPRVGRGGEMFPCFKLRTMAVDSA